MTVRDLLAESARLGVRLVVHADRLRIEAPKGVVTAKFRAALADQKPTLLDVLWRLDEMRRLAVVAPRPVIYARESAVGGPGRCFSCGDRLEQADAYGRCTPCDIAADAFYALQRDSDARQDVA